jgi:RHS repeat-associated protein
VYDGDGNRVSETVAGVTTNYVVADINPTGYAQVLDELPPQQPGRGVVSNRSYTYGLFLINQRLAASSSQLSYYGYDGHGSVRFLMDKIGAVTDTYDYDAFGNLINSAGTTPNNYLFAGEQFDPALGIYYNRARCYDQRSGRFWSMDLLEAFGGDPAAIHKYTYAHNNPVTRRDPSGLLATSVLEVEEAEDVEESLDTQVILQPAIAGGAEAVAETAATVSALRVAFQFLFTISIFAGPIVAVVLPSDTPNDTDDRRRRPPVHRGRLQVQGEDIAKQKYDLTGHKDFNYKDDTLSWPWSQADPLLASSALKRLSEFLEILTYEQIGRRAKAFSDASRFIVNASLGGGIGPPGPPSFNARDPKVKDARVDIEVQAGRAFVPE